jgi:replicative DNA helicase
MGESTKGETYVKIAKHRNGSLDTVKLKALLHIQKFVEDNDDDGGGFGGGNPGGNFRPVRGDEGADGAKLYIQKGSKMNDGNFDDETPF